MTWEKILRTQLDAAEKARGKDCPLCPFSVNQI